MGRWAAQTSRVRVSARSRHSLPLYPHFNRLSGFWPCAKSCLVGGSDKCKYIRHYIPEMTLTDYMCQEKEEEDLPALKTVLTIRRLHRKARGKTGHIHQKQYWLHEEEQNGNNQKGKGEEKQFYGRFKRLTSDILHEKTWTWLRKWNLKRETESLLIAAQNNAIRTNQIKARIDKTQQNSRCRLCGDRDETINPIISECSKLTQRDYKTKQEVYV